MKNDVQKVFLGNLRVDTFLKTDYHYMYQGNLQEEIERSRDTYRFKILRMSVLRDGRTTEGTL